MSPPQDAEDVLKSFDPDTYIRHELDGKPIPKYSIPKNRFVVDYYGNREYVGRDPYGFFNKPTDLHNTERIPQSLSPKYHQNYSSCYDTSHNPDYQLSDNQSNLKSHCNTSTQELQGKAIPKHICKPWLKELHFDSGCTGSKGKIVTYELDANHYEDTISTSLDSTNFNTHLEFVRNFILEDYPKAGVLSNINLGVKIVNSNIVYIYIKFKEISKRRILWTIWERDRGRYYSYEQFKTTWDSNMGVISKIRKDMKNDIRVEVEDLLGIRKIKKDLKKSVKSEVEKLLRERRPFDRF